MTGEGAGGFAHQIGVFHRDSAKDHALQPFGKPHLDGRHVTDAAAQLGGHFALLENLFDRGGVDRLAREGAVQINKVQPLTARLDKFQRLRGGVFVEHGRLFHLAFVEAHGIAVFQIDGGIEDHGAGLLS